jgi:hypothetical protein
MGRAKPDPRHRKHHQRRSSPYHAHAPHSQPRVARHHSDCKAMNLVGPSRPPHERTSESQILTWVTLSIRGWSHSRFPAL